AATPKVTSTPSLGTDRRSGWLVQLLGALHELRHNLRTELVDQRGLQFGHPLLHLQQALRLASILDPAELTRLFGLRTKRRGLLLEASRLHLEVGRLVDEVALLQRVELLRVVAWRHLRQLAVL